VTFRGEARLWIAQRASAAVLAVCVAVHLYSLFVLAVTVHAPIGLRSVLSEWLGWRGRARDFALLLFAAFLGWTGMRAVLGVFA